MCFVFFVSLQEAVKSFGNVAYIDVVNGCREGHVRCADSETASKIARTSVVGDYFFSLVQGSLAYYIFSSLEYSQVIDDTQYVHNIWLSTHNSTMNTFVSVTSNHIGPLIFLDSI